ncbi:MAG: alanine--tRNA ligase, partial [Clostridiales bacterium]|nr:alanine--tRNA ligase [Clostridiales bacterium]
APGCECDRFIEVWNLVFTQFDRQDNDEYLPLKMKNIDTGMGLERLACVMQGVDNLFEVDTIRSTLDKTCDIAKVEYKKNTKKDISIRLITDHVRSSVMLVSDGVIPSNEGRGYVLRRLLRRAARHGRLLGVKGTFMSDIVKDVIEKSGEAYPELISRREYIEKVIKIEEERFQSTVDQGLSILTNIIEEIKVSGSDTIKGTDIFKLHDTFGFPYELTEEIASEQNIKMDEEGFKLKMQMQKDMARNAQKAEDGSQAWGGNEEDAFEDIEPTVFTGYKRLIETGKVLKIVNLNGILEVALDKTSFYAESGGQVGDIGFLKSDKGFKMQVTDCIKTHTGVFIHKGKVVTGAISEGDLVTAEVDKSSRKATERNHTATHILQFALQYVLGNHVAQAGSHVGPDRMRFDFTHFSAMTNEEVKEVEALVNEKILEDADVDVNSMSISEAREKGAMALFGEKYGDTVRVVSTGDFSMELCGGTHLEHTSSAGLFVIVAESGVAAGVRRIEALTGTGAIEYLQNKKENLAKISNLVKSTDANAPDRINKLLKELKSARKEIDNLKKKAATGNASGVLDKPIEINGTKTIIAEIKGVDMNTLRSMCDAARERYDDSVILLISENSKVSCVAAATQKAVAKGIHCGKLIGQVAGIIGGGGGGRPDMAQAGGKDSAKISEALEKARELIGEVLK